MLRFALQFDFFPQLAGVGRRRPAVSVIALCGLAIAMTFTACGGGFEVPANGSHQEAAPTITSVVPDTSPLTGGKTVIINGTNFTNNAQSATISVTFGGVPSPNVTVVSDSQISAVTPPHAAGTVNVMVTTPDGQSASASDAFTYAPAPPTMSSVSPTSGPVTGGTAVTIIGTNFVSGATVSFGGTSASGVSFVSSTQLKATTPTHAAGTVTVAVTNPDGTQTALANAFTYGASSVAVSRVSPISGPAAGGTQVTISGSNFQSGLSVTFGGLAATAVMISNSTTVLATTPAHSAGSVSVTVTNPNGQSTSLPSGFAYHSVELYWSPPSTTSVTIIGYNVYRSESPAGPFAKISGSTPVAGTSFTDATVFGSTSYYYEVTSVDSNGVESPPDGPIQIITGP